MSSRWFTYQAEIVSGPFTNEEVKARLQGQQLQPTDLIWGRGLESWQTLRWWSQELPRLSDTTVIVAIAENWHYALGGKSHGPFNRPTLIAELKHVHPVNDVMVWTKGMKEWAPIFEFHDLLTEVGVNKRVFPRAELEGKAVIKADGQTLVAPLMTISEGGFGVNLETGLVSGQSVAVEIQASVFRQPLNARAEVRYTSDGVVGLRFQNLNSEAKASIINFVRQNQTRFVLKAA